MPFEMSSRRLPSRQCEDSGCVTNQGSAQVPLIRAGIETSLFRMAVLLSDSGASVCAIEHTLQTLLLVDSFTSRVVSTQCLHRGPVLTRKRLTSSSARHSRGLPVRQFSTLSRNSCSLGTATSNRNSNLNQIIDSEHYEWRYKLWPCDELTQGVD